MLVESRRTNDTASAADAAVHTIVKGGFHFARRDMASRKQCLVGRTSPWWVRGRQKSPRKNAPRVTDEQKQDILGRQLKEAPPITYEQKQDNSDRPVKKALPITYEHEVDILKLVNSLPEREMEIAFNIAREGTPKSPDVVDQKLGVELDKFPNELLHSLLRFARVHESRIKEIMPARPASAADSAALAAPLPTLTRSETA